MYLPGHLATAYLLSRRAPPLRLALTALGALLPDLLDTPFLWLGFTPYGRTVGHALLLWCGALALWLWARRPPMGGAVLLGGFSHLVADLANDVNDGFERSGAVFSAWMGWPLTDPEMANVRVLPLLAPMRHMVTTLELATVATCLIIVVRRPR